MCPKVINPKITGGGRREKRGDSKRWWKDTWLEVVNTIQYTDNVLQNFIPETYILLLTNVTPINSIKW